MSDKLFDKHIKSKLEDLKINSDKAGWAAFSAKHGDIIGEDTSDAAFDDVVKNKISELSGAPEQASWAAFAEQFADELGDEYEDQFDTAIKDKVKDLELDKPIAAWAAFEALHGASLSDPSFDQFDNIVKDKLSDIPVSSSANWEHFEDRLYSELNSDQDFDASLKERMDTFRVPFKPGHWAIMKARLERIKYIKERLYTSKALELVMLFLLVFTIGNNLEVFKQNKQKGASEIVTQAIANTDVQSFDEKGTSEVDLNVTNRNERQAKPESSEINSGTTTRNLNQLSATTSAAPIGVALANATNNTPSAIIPRNPSDIRNTTPQKTIETISQSVSLIPKVNVESIQITRLDKKSLGLDSEQRSLSIENQDLADFAGLMPANVSTNGVWFHSVFSIDQNYINSYYGKAVTEDPYRVVSQGYSMGILLGLEREKMGVSTGVQFGNYFYTPEKKEERYYRKVDGQGAYYKISLAMIEHNTMNIPLNLDFKLLPASSKWNLTASTGASLNLITSTNYDIQNELDEKLPDNVPQPSSWQYPQEFAGKNYLQGLNQGGSFSETASLYLKAGLGIQRNFGNALALYVQPSYQYQLLNNRIHPNLDHINRLSVNMGMKFKFVMPER